MRPLVSVVVPVRDRPRLLVEALQSVAAQDFDDYEVIVVDDGSRRPAGKAVAGARLRRFRYVRLPQNRGAPAARRIGVQMSRGRWIAFLDADDLWYPHKLSAQWRWARRSSVLFVYTNYEFADRKGTKTARPKKGGLANLPTLPLTSTAMVRADYLKRLGGLGGGFRHLYDDYDLWRRIDCSLLPRSWHFIREPLVFYRGRRGQLSREDRSAREKIFGDAGGAARLSPRQREMMLDAACFGHRKWSYK